MARIDKEAFRQELTAKAKAVKPQALEEKKPDVFALVKDAMDEIRVLLKEKKGPVKFIVTERDENGKIKSFRMER